MVRPGNEPEIRLRASHADRDQVIGTLKVAFVQGRLAKDEFEQRVGKTLGSQTYAELAAITADLPVGRSAAEPPKPASARPSRAVLLVLAGILAAEQLLSLTIPSLVWILTTAIHLARF
jgi:hypothetical protein